MNENDELKNHSDGEKMECEEKKKQKCESEKVSVLVCKFQTGTWREDKEAGG